MLCFSKNEASSQSPFVGAVTITGSIYYRRKQCEANYLRYKPLILPYDVSEVSINRYTSIEVFKSQKNFWLRKLLVTLENHFHGEPSVHLLEHPNQWRWALGSCVFSSFLITMSPINSFLLSHNEEHSNWGRFSRNSSVKSVGKSHHSQTAAIFYAPKGLRVHNLSKSSKLKFFLLNYFACGK